MSKKTKPTKNKLNLQLLLLATLSLVLLGLLVMTSIVYPFVRTAPVKTSLDFEVLHEEALEQSGTAQTDIIKAEDIGIGITNDSQNEENTDQSDLQTVGVDSKEDWLEKEYILETASKDEVVLAFGGDILFDDSYSAMISYLDREENLEDCISQDLLEQMRQADLFMLNNEFTYTNRGEPVAGKTYTFRADPKYVSLLADMGVDIVSLANNHAYDFGEISLLDTLDTLREAKIPYVGAGADLEEASKPAYYTANDMKIAIVAATQIERLDNPDTKGATVNSPGVFRCWNSDQLLETIKEADKESDFVVVYVHWGSENTTQLDWAQTDQAKEYVAAGADLIIGDHPHCLQTIDYIEGVPVIYSLGNFWFNSKTIDTGLIKVKVDKEGILKLEFVPCIQTNCRTSLLSGLEKQRVIDYMQSLSPNIAIDSEGYIQEK